MIGYKHSIHIHIYNIHIHKVYVCGISYLHFVRLGGNGLLGGATLLVWRHDIASNKMERKRKRGLRKKKEEGRRKLEVSMKIL